MPREIRTAAGGMGLDGLLRGRGRASAGILNGIDDDGLEPGDRPASRRALLRPRKLDARARPTSAALQARFGLAPDPTAPLFGVVSRLTWQKGHRPVLAALAGAARRRRRSSPCSAPATRRWRRASAARGARIRGRVGCVIGYDEALAHLLQAGADAILVPSRFEPCGLTQLCALRYGALPVVARVGGLADTVIDANEAALAAGVRHRRAVRTRRCRDAGQRAPARTVGLCARAGRPGAACSAMRMAWTTCPGAGPPRATPRCIAS